MPTDLRATIKVTDAAGNVFEGEATLTLVGSAKRAKRSHRTREAPQSSGKLDFTKNERAFLKTHAQNLSGPKKFVLILAYLTKGNIGTEVPLNIIEARWNKATTHLGGVFNRFYSNSAKDNGWVDSPKKGIYALSSTWKDALA
jgi:hypothetical protein